MLQVIAEFVEVLGGHPGRPQTAPTCAGCRPAV